MPWSLDLEDCARRSVAIGQLAAHWQRVVPGPFMEIRYEDLVDDPEGQSRRLIAFLGLDWDPACLAFHRTERKVTTASVIQVRQPIYRSAIGKWRHYAAHLQPMLRILDAG
jgi:hypothetical protein